jgi:hypothetical protein
MMDESAIMREFLGGNPSQATRIDQQIPHVVEGTVLGLDGNGLYFVVKGWDQRLRFGPCPWPRTLLEPTSHSHSSTEPVSSESHDHEGSVPTVGARCLILFVPPGIDRPWCIGWWPS